MFRRAGNTLRQGQGRCCFSRVSSQEPCGHASCVSHKNNDKYDDDGSKVATTTATVLDQKSTSLSLIVFPTSSSTGKQTNKKRPPTAVRSMRLEVLIVLFG